MLFRSEMSRAAIHNGELFAVDFNIAVVDRKTAKGCEQMLNGTDRDALIVPDHSTECEAFDVIDVSVNLGNQSSALGDDEFEPGIGFRRMEDQGNRSTTMNPSPRQLDLSGDRRLTRADESIRHSALSLGTNS